MRAVGALEAKNRFGQLLDWVEDGEEVTITRHDKEIARLVPARPSIDRDVARATLKRIRARAEQCPSAGFDWAEWKTWRDEGCP